MKNGFEKIEATLNELCDSYSEIFDGITTIENMKTNKL